MTEPVKIAVPFLTVLLAAILLSACGSPPPREPAALDRARKSEQAAYRAMREGDLFRARELFNQSKLIHRSLDNANEWSMNTINLASVLHKQGNDTAALQELDAVLTEKNNPPADENLSVAAFRKGIILTNNASFDEALKLLQQAETWCKSDCPHQGGMKNLRARIALKQGNIESALELATKVHSNSSTPAEELANAYRLAATAELMQGKTEMAIQHFQAALNQDKLSGLSARIADDLEGLSQCYLKQGNQSAAESYAFRAAEVRNARTKVKENPGNRAIP